MERCRGAERLRITPPAAIRLWESLFEHNCKALTAKSADPEPMPAEATATAIGAAMDQAGEKDQPVDEIAEAAANGAEITTEIIDTEDGDHEVIIIAEDDPQDDPIPETMTVYYDVPGSARKGPTPSGRSLASIRNIRPRPHLPTSSATILWIAAVS